MNPTLVEGSNIDDILLSRELTDMTRYYSYRDELNDGKIVENDTVAKIFGL